MKTESTVSAAASARSRATSIAAPDPLDVGRNPGLEIRAGHIGADVQVARLEMKSRPFRRRELQLGSGYGLAKLVAQSQLSTGIGFASGQDGAGPNPRMPPATERTYPIGMVLSACADFFGQCQGRACELALAC
jgi:hypothetical protein